MVLRFVAGDAEKKPNKTFYGDKPEWVDLGRGGINPAYKFN